MVLYLLLALLSGLAPRGVEQVQTVDTQHAIVLAARCLDDGAVIHQSSPHHSQYPDAPLEMKEQEVREFEFGDAHKATVVRTCFAFLSSFLAPSACLPSPPTVVRAPHILPPSGTSRTILHQVFRI